MAQRFTFFPRATGARLQSNMTHIDLQLEPLLRLVLALLLGGVIGLERRWRGHVAGPHANALVAMGAALFMLLAGGLGSDGLAREAAQIAAGVGFLAGGVILRDGLKVRGLNTAATVWCTAAMGCIAGTGNYALASGSAFIIVLGNSLFHYFEHDFFEAPPPDDTDIQNQPLGKDD
jgi:putative Mg2+ transporter-C (MgtC) family protein